MKYLAVKFLCLFFALGMLSCGKDDDPAPQQELPGSLEGKWKVTNIYPVRYDQQDRVITVYDPRPNYGYTHLAITNDKLHYYDELTKISEVSYVRTDNQISCPLPERSYVIKKLTVTKLELHLRGEYAQFGNSVSRVDFTIHFERQ